MTCRPQVSSVTSLNDQAASFCISATFLAGSFAYMPAYNRTPKHTQGTRHSCAGCTLCRPYTVQYITVQTIHSTACNCAGCTRCGLYTVRMYTVRALTVQYHDDGALNGVSRVLQHYTLLHGLFFHWFLGLGEHLGIVLANCAERFMDPTCTFLLEQVLLTTFESKFRSLITQTLYRKSQTG